MHLISILTPGANWDKSTLAALEYHSWITYYDEGRLAFEKPTRTFSVTSQIRKTLLPFQENILTNNNACIILSFNSMGCSKSFIV